jgi:hypothetical protein
MLNEKNGHAQRHVVAVALGIWGSAEKPDSLWNDRAIVSQYEIEEACRSIGNVYVGVGIRDNRVSDKEGVRPLL